VACTSIVLGLRNCQIFPTLISEIHMKLYTLCIFWFW